MIPFFKYSLLIIAFFTLSGFTLEKGSVTIKSTINAPSLQPQDERAVQNGLPIAKGKIWDLLATTKVSLDEEKGEYSAIFPDEVKDLNEQTIKVSGFILPLESSEKFTHFLLSKRTPTCPFCPPGTPTEIIEVYTDTPIEWIDDLVEIEGKFSVIDNKEMGIFFKLSDASLE